MVIVAVAGLLKFKFQVAVLFVICVEEPSSTTVAPT
jgi:hypothetical protein